MLAGMRDLIPHELIGHGHSDAEYKERGSSHKSEFSSIFKKKPKASTSNKREPINFQEWHKPGSGVYHKRGGAFDSLFYDYLTQ